MSSKPETEPNGLNKTRTSQRNDTEPRGDHIPDQDLEFRPRSCWRLKTSRFSPPTGRAQAYFRWKGQGQPHYGGRCWPIVRCSPIGQSRSKRPFPKLSSSGVSQFPREMLNVTRYRKLPECPITYDDCVNCFSASPFFYGLYKTPACTIRVSQCQLNLGMTLRPGLGPKLLVS